MKVELKRKKLTDEQIFQQAVLRGEIPDKDGFYRAVGILEEVHREIAVPKKSRLSQTRSLLKEFETGSASTQRKITTRLQNLTNLLGKG